MRASWEQTSNERLFRHLFGLKIWLFFHTFLFYFIFASLAIQEVGIVAYNLRKRESDAVIEVQGLWGSISLVVYVLICPEVVHHQTEFKRSPLCLILSQIAWSPCYWSRMIGAAGPNILPALHQRRVGQNVFYNMSSACTSNT